MGHPQYYKQTPWENPTLIYTLPSLFLILQKTIFQFFQLTTI